MELWPVSGFLVRNGDTGWHDVWSFVSAFLSLYAPASKSEKQKLEDDLKHACKEGFDSLLHQLRVWIWLQRAGFSVTIADADKTRKSFDFLAKNTNSEFEVECKSISADKGRHVHRSEVDELTLCIEAEILKILGSVRDPIAVVVQIQDRFPKTPEARTGIAEAVLATFRDGMGRKPWMGVRVARLPSGHPRPSDGEEAVRRWVEMTLGTHQNYSIMYSNERTNLLLVVYSLQRDSLVTVLGDELRRAHRRQLSGHRPAILAIGLNDIFPDDLEELKSSSLADVTLDFLAKSTRTYVRGVVYFAETEILSDEAKTVERLHFLAFRNPQPTPFTQDEFLELDGWPIYQSAVSGGTRE